MLNSFHTRTIGMTGKKTKHLVKRASLGVGEFVAITVFAKSDDCGLMGGVTKWTLLLSAMHMGFPNRFWLLKLQT